MICTRSGATCRRRRDGGEDGDDAKAKKLRRSSSAGPTQPMSAPSGPKSGAWGHNSAVVRASITNHDAGLGHVRRVCLQRHLPAHVLFKRDSSLVPMNCGAGDASEDASEFGKTASRVGHARPYYCIAPSHPSQLASFEKSCQHRVKSRPRRLGSACPGTAAILLVMAADRGFAAAQLLVGSRALCNLLLALGFALLMLCLLPKFHFDHFIFSL